MSCEAAGQTTASRIWIAFGSVWVSDNANGVVYQIDPASPKQYKVIPVGGFSGILASGIADADGSIWVTVNPHSQ